MHCSQFSQYLWLWQGISSLRQLQLLDVSNNHLTSVCGLQSLQQLQDLWLNDNQIPDVKAIEAGLDGSRASITCIYFANNPGITNKVAYKRSCLQWFPNLQQLDADFVR